MSAKRVCLSAACFLTTALVPLMAAAADTGNVFAIEEVVVTATKRETRLIDTPAQINAISADYLEQFKIQQFADLSGSIPNLLAPNGLTGTEAVTVRGISSPARGGNIAEQPVSSYVDGVFAISGSLDGLIHDIERIEVIRGPQGVVWGRNTLAGAISFTTRRPTRDWEGSIEGGIGNKDLLEARATLSGPVIEDVLLFRVATAHQERDGYSERVSGGTYGALNREAVRGTLEYVGVDGLDVTLITDYSENDFTSMVPEFFSGPFAAAAGTDGFRRRQDTDYFRPGHSKAFGLTGLVTYDFGPVTLSSVTGYRTLKQTSFFDFDGSSQFLIHDDAMTDADQFSQELRLSNSARDGNRLNWMLGGYYYKRNDTLTQTETYGPTLSPFLGAPDGSMLAMDVTSDTGTESYSAFATVSYDITDRLTINGGLRVSHDMKDNDVALGSSLILADGTVMPLGMVPGLLDLSETTTSPLVGISYKPAQDMLVYASWGRGYKSGGFNSPLVSKPSFGPEKADSFEAGYKASFLDNRLSVNLAAFFINYRNLQSRALEGLNALFVNAGKAHSKGVELEVTAVPAKGWNVSASAGLNSAKYKSFTLNGADLAGNRLPFAPRSSLALRSDYTVPVSDLGDLSLQGEWTYVGRYMLDVQNTPTGRQPGYSLFNARVAFAMANGVELAVWGRNLTDKDYRVDFIGNLPAFIFGGSEMQVLGPSRTYGAEIKARF